MAKHSNKKDSPRPESPASAARHPPLQAVDRGLFYMTASITGATVMMIELLGTRIIRPYYGVSMIVGSSLLSTALLGFFLLPLFGTENIVLSLSVLMLVLSFLLALYENLRLNAGSSLLGWGATTAGLAVALLLGVGSTLGTRDYPNSRVVFEEETHYGWVRVVDQPERGIRWLMSGGSTIGAEHLETEAGLLGYQQVVGHLPRFHPTGEDALLVGLGSGHLVITDKLQSP